MRVYTVLLLLLFTRSFQASAEEVSSPLDIVNQRMQAHNAHNIDAFLAAYSPEIQVYDYPNTPLGQKGHAHLRSIFEPLFKDKAVSVDIHSQLEHGKYIINQETVTRRGEQFRYLSIYEVEDGLIISVRFLREY